MPRIFNTPRSAEDTDLPEYWLDGKYSSKIIKRQITVLSLGFASGVALFAGLSALSSGIPMLAAICFGGTLIGLHYARRIIGTLKTWQWLDRKRAHEFELDLVTLQNDHTTLKYQHGLLAGMVRRGEADAAKNKNAASADVVVLRRDH